MTSKACCRITTGAPLPRGADAVIQVEDTEVVKSSEDVCVCKNVTGFAKMCVINTSNFAHLGVHKILICRLEICKEW